MSVFLGYIAFITAFMAVGCIVLYVVEKLIVFLYKQSFQCRQADYEYLYDFVKKHNATITDRNKL